MSNRSNRRSSRRRGGRRQSDQRSGEPAGGEKRAGGPVHLKGPRSLERLREKVEEAAQELERLRTENARLAERLREAEARPVLDVDGTVLAFDEEPEAVRQKVAGFIEAVDRYLDASTASETASETASDAPRDESNA